MFLLDSYMFEDGDVGRIVVGDKAGASEMKGSFVNRVFLENCFKSKYNNFEICKTYRDFFGRT